MCCVSPGMGLGTHWYIAAAVRSKAAVSFRRADSLARASATWTSSSPTCCQQRGLHGSGLLSMRGVSLCAFSPHPSRCTTPRRCLRTASRAPTKAASAAAVPERVASPGFGALSVSPSGSRKPHAQRVLARTYVSRLCEQREQPSGRWVGCEPSGVSYHLGGCQTEPSKPAGPEDGSRGLLLQPAPPARMRWWPLCPAPQPPAAPLPPAVGLRTQGKHQ